jgi:hypothetical protein
MQRLRNKVYKILLNDSDFRKLGEKHKLEDIEYKVILSEALAYCFNSDFKPFLEEAYLDISYLELNYYNKRYLIDLDAIYEVFKEYVEETKE